MYQSNVTEVNTPETIYISQVQTTQTTPRIELSIGDKMKPSKSVRTVRLEHDAVEAIKMKSNSLNTKI